MPYRFVGDLEERESKVGKRFDCHAKQPSHRLKIRSTRLLPTILRVVAMQLIIFFISSTHQEMWYNYEITKNTSHCRSYVVVHLKITYQGMRPSLRWHYLPLYCKHIYLQETGAKIPKKFLWMSWIWWIQLLAFSPLFEAVYNYTSQPSSTQTML